MKIKILKMDWWNNFSCIGGACPMTCCQANWGINLTDEEIEGYEKLEHPFRTSIVAAIDKEGKCMKNQDGYCPLLTKDGWCQIVRECGEEYLSYTCKTFPREKKWFGDVLEATVGIACPVVAGYLLNPGMIEFSLDEIELNAMIGSVDYQMYDNLSMVRSYLIDLVQSYEGNFLDGKLYIVLSMLYKIREMLGKDGLNRNELLQQMEFYEKEETRAVVFVQGEKIAENYRERAAVLQNFLKCMQLQINDIDVWNSVQADTAWRENIQLWIEDLNALTDSLQGFSEYFRKNYLHMLENYFVYTLFSAWIELEEDKFGNEFIIKIMELVEIQVLAMSKWREKGEIEQGEYELLIARMERIIGHSGKTDELYSVIKNLGIDRAAGLLMLSVW